MKRFEYLLLFLLAAIWGSSFIFMRVLAPVFGATGTACLRLMIAATFLIVYYAIRKYSIHLKRDRKLFLIIGIINSAIPFSLYAFAALHIPASLSVIINSMSPMFGLLFSVMLLNEKLTLQKTFGLLLGVAGVVIISNSKAVPSDSMAYLSIAACLGAAICYGLSGVLIRLYAKHIESKAMAAGSQLFAGLSLIPFAIVSPPTQPIPTTIALLMIVFAVLCSAIAYLIYYHLLSTLGPTKALTVTFLMPAFGTLWGYLILGEAIYGRTLLGMAVILSGTFLVTGSIKKRCPS